MGSELTVGELGDIAQVVMGQSPAGNSCNQEGEGTPLLNGPTEFGGRYPSPTQFTTDPKKFAEPGDLLFCVRGSTTGRMNWADQRYAIGRGLGAIRHKYNPDCQPYIRAVIDFCLPNLLAEATGSTFPNVSRDQLNKLKVPVFCESGQKAIAHILGSIDDKIELNRQMNETLEAMAQALFKSWFVDFDPVIDNALAAGNDIPEPLQKRAATRQALGEQRKPLPAHIQSLFPDRFVFTDEMGWVPEGWEHVQISVLCEKIQNGGTPKRDNALYWENPSIPWLTSGEVRQNLIHKSENAISEAGLKGSSAKWLPELSTVVAMYGATAGQVALITQPMTTNQAICGLIPVKPYRYFNYLALERKVADLANQARGSAQQNISKKIIEETKTIKPSEQMINLFTEEVESCFGKWSENIQQMDTLAGLRDTLLPKLLSGELRIPDAEKQVAEAV